MKILYFGTVCDLAEYEKMLSNCSSKPSIAPIVFETSLLSGFKKNNAEVEVYSFPMIPTFPSFKKLWWGSKREKLSCGYKTTWLKTINIPIIKQFSRKIDAKRILKKFLKSNKGQDCAVLTYSIPPFLAKSVVKYCNKYNVKCYAVVTDLLRDMYMNAQDSSIVTKLKNFYLNNAIKYQGCYDGYIYLTEAMKDVINPEKPYIVVEGIADISNVQPPSITEKNHPKVIMYAGMLHENYGVLNLLEAFRKFENNDVELWLFGDGNCVDKINEYCEKDSRIKFFGRVERDKILNTERQASLLVNIRNTDDDYTKYSFPSKTIEYMLSGTPVLTSKLSGIPDEYFNYVYTVESNRVDDILKALQEIFNKSDKDNCEVGFRAQKFIVENKNSVVQASNILKFMKN